MSDKIRDLYVEEVTHLRRSGESTERIVQRMGLRADSLARALHREKRTDLARPFWALAKRERKVKP